MVGDSDFEGNANTLSQKKSAAVKRLFLESERERELLAVLVQM